MSYQDNPFLPQVLSPAAYEMGRYGRTPVSYYHGLPNISIPLTEVRAKGFSLPISLSYHAGGNKPELHPGWVGLGWSLNAGGSIVRVVNGLKDEMSTAEFSSNNEAVDYLSRIAEVQVETDWEDSDVFYSKIRNDIDLDNNAFNNIDYSPDEYIINAPGIQASFFITGDNQISVVSKDGAMIELETYSVVEDSEATYLDMYACPKQLKAKRYR